MVKAKKKKESNKEFSPKSKEYIVVEGVEEKPIKREILKERVETGIKNFDNLIEGGFRKNSTNLVVGSSGGGKTIFAVQFLIEGIKRGETCLYITFEEKREEFYTNMLEFGWDLEKLEKSGKFIFLEYTPEKVRTMINEGGGMIESIVLSKKVSRIVIDSITSFELLFGEDIKKREASLALFGIIRKWECTSLLTYETEPSREMKGSTSSLEFESDSIILMYYLRDKKERKRYIEVLKMRGTKHSREIFGFSIDKNGINIDKKSTSDVIKI